MEIGTEIIAFIGGTGSLVLTKVFDFIGTKRSNHKAALEFAFVFEGFAIDLYNELEMGNVTIGPHGPGNSSKLPELDEKLIKSLALEQIKIKIRQRIMDYPDQVKIYQGHVSRGIHAIDTDQVIEVARERMKFLGRTALSIADDLRNEYRLPKRSLMLKFNHNT